MIDPLSGFPFQSAAPARRSMFRTLGISASGLSAQRQRMEVIATNIANAEVTRTPEGTPYRRRVVRMETAPTDATLPATPAPLDGSEPPETATGVRVAAVEEDASEGPLIYDPGHPDANPAGYVRYPNVRITDELVDLMDARRVYEANATVFQSAKAMLRRSLDI